MGEKELTFGNNSQFLFPESTVPRVLAYKARLAIGNEQQFEQFYKSLETNLLFDNTTEASNHDGELFHIQWIKFQSQALSFSVDGKTSDGKTFVTIGGNHSSILSFWSFVNGWNIHQKGISTKVVFSVK